MKKNPAMINMKIMHDIFGNNPEAIKKYIEHFIKVTSELLAKTKLAIDKQDSQLALEYFHQLKGPVGSIGLMEMYHVCEKAEDNIKRSDWNAALKNCGGFRNEVQFPFVHMIC